MPSITTIQSLNQSIKHLKPTVLVVGGTSGIGQHTALKLAEHTSPNKIIITGRNKQAGDQIVSQLNTLSNSSNNEFVACDVTRMKNVFAFTQEIKSKLTKLNMLVMSPGYLSTSGRDETDEGIDKKLACHFYARFLLIRELLPLLEQAAKDGEDARVLTVLAAGKEGQIYPDDPDLKHHYGLKAAADVATTYNSLMVEEFARRHPSVSFSHIYPGFVKTNIMNNLPWYLKYPSMAIAYFATSPEDSGEVMTYALTSDKFKTGWHLLNERGDPLQPSKYHTRENIDLMWNHAEKLTNVEH